MESGLIIQMTLPNFSSCDRIALFLDFDGTIAAIASHPDEVVLDKRTRNALLELEKVLNGALAIITGRDIAAVDRFLAPLHLPVAGVHGLTRRNAQGQSYKAVEREHLAAAIEQALLPFVKEHPGLLLERKFGAIALHFRNRPELEKRCVEIVESVIADQPLMELKRGKMVVEAKAAGGNKGAAVADFLQEEPFVDRLPVVAGDDLTDEDAFDLVNDKGGVSIKIGLGETAATHQVSSIGGFLDWLIELPSKLEDR